jgi:hypothetical protein
MSRSQSSVAAIRRLGERLIAVVETAPDPAAVVPFTERWNVAQVLAHLVTVAVRC